MVIMGGNVLFMSEVALQLPDLGRGEVDRVFSLEIRSGKRDVKQREMWSSIFPLMGDATSPLASATPAATS